MPDPQEAAELGQLIDRYRLSQGFNPLPTDDHNRAVVAWYEVLAYAKVPRESWPVCYRAAMQRRAERKAEGREVWPLSADDLVAEFQGIRRLNDELDKSRLLPQHAAAPCPRCFGTGFERMPDGSVRPGCKHEPIDEGAAADISRSVLRPAPVSHVCVCGHERAAHNRFGGRCSGAGGGGCGCNLFRTREVR